MKFPSHLPIDNNVAKRLMQTCKASDICLPSEIAVNVDLEIAIDYILQSCKANLCRQFLKICKEQFLYHNLLVQYKTGTNTVKIDFILFLTINSKAR